jgi:hypothetical protein
MTWLPNIYALSWLKAFRAWMHATRPKGVDREWWDAYKRAFRAGFKAGVRVEISQNLNEDGRKGWFEQRRRAELAEEELKRERAKSAEYIQNAFDSAEQRDAVMRDLVSAQALERYSEEGHEREFKLRLDLQKQNEALWESDRRLRGIVNDQLEELRRYRPIISRLDETTRKLIG